MSTSRRDFVKGAAWTTGVAAGPAIRPAWGQSSPNDRVNVAVIGFHGRGQSHYQSLARLPNVRVAYLCDIDERLFPDAVAAVERIGGNKPATEYDFRRLLDKKDIDAVSIATPDHWHALQTIWACQAGKDVYVEKPVSYSVVEGRRMVEAARKYNRIVQAGLNMRSEGPLQSAIRFVQSGQFGTVYRAKSVVYRGRASIGRAAESPIPKGVHWDLFLGPAPYRPFTLNRFHYGWHYFWDTTTTEVGCNGVHVMDAVRWGLGKKVHPVKIHCAGGRYLDDSDQDTPNVQNASFEYADGMLVELEVTTLFSPPFGGVQMIGSFFYTSKGYVCGVGLSGSRWSTVLTEFTPANKPDLPSGVSQRAFNASFPEIAYKPGPAVPGQEKEEKGAHFRNFIDCVRSRKREELYCEIEEGHMSTALCHLANISYRTGRKLVFDPATEKFPGDKEANAYLTRQYRAPYVLPERV